MTCGGSGLRGHHIFPPLHEGSFGLLASLLVADAIRRTSRRVRCAFGFLGDLSLFLDLSSFIEKRSTSSTLGHCLRLDVCGLFLSCNLLRAFDLKIDGMMLARFWLLAWNRSRVCAWGIGRFIVSRWRSLFPPLRV